MSEQCRSCGKEIIWVRTAATGALMPLDPDPAPDGNVVLVDGKAHVMSGELFDPVLEGSRYKSHFATCPNAAKHRKRK